MKADEILDLRGLPCPGNLPKLIFKLEMMHTNEVLELILDDIIALDRIPEALKDEESYALMHFEKRENANIHMFIKIISE